MRTLWYVPTFHTTDESFIGSEMAKTQPALRLQLQREDRRIMRAWTRLNAQLDALIASGDMDPRRLLVFSDGLPHPISRYPGFIREGRFKGNAPTWDTIRRLRDLGATVCGTESLQLITMYGMYVIARLDDPTLREDKKMERDLLRLRDIWIAENLTRTLRDGRDAILFMGAMHRVDRFVRLFAPDIRIVRLRTILPRGYKR